MFTYASSRSAHLPTLDGLRGKGIFAQFYDPDAERHPLPTYPFRWAPKGLYTDPPAPRHGAAARAGRTSPRKSCGGTAARPGSPTSTAKTSPSRNDRPPRPNSSPSARHCVPAASARPAAPRSPTASRALPANATTARTGATDDTPILSTAI